LLPVFVLLSAVGIFGSSKLIADIWVCFAAGILAYFLKKVSVPITPLIIAFIISSLLEANLRRGLMIVPDQSIWWFFQSPLACALFALAILIFIWSIAKEIRHRRKSMEIRPEKD
jgi:putative tricarboxylic transport membrane protein